MADAKTWAKRVAAWRRSGLTAPEFASKEGVSPRTLRYWAWRLERAAEPTLLRVVSTATVPDRAAPLPAVVTVPGATQGEAVPMRIVAGLDESVIEIGAGDSRVEIRVAADKRELFALILREVATALFATVRAERSQ